MENPNPQKTKSLVDVITGKIQQELKDVPKGAQAYAIPPHKKKGYSTANLLGLARSIFSLVLITSCGIWLYFYAVLDANNYFHAKFERQNLTTQINQKMALRAQLKQGLESTNEFSKLLLAENLLKKVIKLDLNNPILEDLTLKQEIEQGEFSEKQERQKIVHNEARKLQTEFTLKALREILLLARDLAKNPPQNSKLQASLNEILNLLTTLKLTKDNFASAVLQERYAAAKSLAQKLLPELKTLNLQNLVLDIKKQVTTLDLSKANALTREMVLNLQNILAALSFKNFQSFADVQSKIEALDLTQINDGTIYKEIQEIIGGGDQIGNLKMATVLASNLSPVNRLNLLSKERIVWTEVLTRVEKVLRLGANLERDLQDLNDARADLDPEGRMIKVESYAGRGEKGEIELHGFLQGKADYEKRDLTLLANLLDAFEQSKYFQNVEGQTFTRNRDRDGQVFVPLRINLTLQDPAVSNALDLTGDQAIKRQKANLADLQKINFPEKEGRQESLDFFETAEQFFAE